MRRVVAGEEVWPRQRGDRMESYWEPQIVTGDWSCCCAIGTDIDVR